MPSMKMPPEMDRCFGIAEGEDGNEVRCALPLNHENGCLPSTGFIPITISRISKPTAMVVHVCTGCGRADKYPVGELDPTELRCCHSFVFNFARGPSGTFDCVNCPLSIPVRAMMHYDRERSRMADAATVVRDENTQLLAENARLRRQVEAASRKKP